MKYFTAAALLAFVAQAQTQDEKDKYPEFAADMEWWGYTWEAFEVTTDDGYILANFHITGKTDGSASPTNPDLHPAFFMNGMMTDAESMTKKRDKTNIPLPLHIYEAGFDTYLGNNRATRYSQKHTKYDIYDKEYWSWGAAEMGIYDDPAALKYIFDKTGKKVSYIGISQGTAQMFYGLSKLEDEFYADHVWTAAMVDPCVIQIKKETKEGGDDFYTSSFEFESMGIYSLGGPDHDTWSANL